MAEKNIYITGLPLRKNGQNSQYQWMHERKKKNLLSYAIRAEYGITCPVEFTHGPYGKPYLSGGFPQFNFSDSGGYLACVLDRDEIGLDIQKIRTVSDRVLERFFPVGDRLWQDISKIEKIAEWTKYESYGKMTGTGIPYEEDYAQGHFLSSFELADYVVTVCFQQESYDSLSIKII